jgi:uncharacterized protein (DUF58 family)
MTNALTLERHASEAAQNLPALLANAETLAATLTAGAHGRRRPGPGETFWQYRDYTQNDPASAIDWRQSARVPNRYFVRETEWETAATVRLWCSQAESMEYGSRELTKLWRAEILTTALALLLTKAGEKIGVLPPDGPGQGGQRAVMTLAEYLVSPHRESEDPLPPLCPPGTTQAVYISDFHAPTEGLVKRLKEIAATGVPTHLIAISDIAEETFPFTGRVLFEPPREHHHARLFGDAKAIADAYFKARRAHFGVVEDTCRRFGFTFIRHRTDGPATPALAQIHNAVAGQVR